MTEVHRADDSKLLSFLKLFPVKQPSLNILRELFANRLLRGALEASVSLSDCLSKNGPANFSSGYASLVKAFGTFI